MRCVYIYIHMCKDSSFYAMCLSKCGALSLHEGNFNQLIGTIY